MKLSLFAGVAACLLCLPVGWAQTAPGPSGHWEGSMEVSDHPRAIEVDLAQNSKGEWIGTMNIPVQQLKAFPLSDVAVNQESVTFALRRVPGEPRFDGRLSPNGTAISGDVTQGDNKFTFLIRRTGDAVIETPPKSAAVSKDMEGSWEGVLEVNKNTLRLRLNMANQEDGTVRGSLLSLIEGGSEIAITTITQNAAHLHFEIKPIHGIWDGDLVDGALVGHWIQGGGSFPLTFKRLQEEKK